MTVPLPDGFPVVKAKNQRLKTDDPALRNKRNRAYGHAKQAVVRRWLEQLTGTQARFQGRKANEEMWSHLPVRVEVKAGQQVGAAATAYLNQERQSDQAKAFGDIRKFIGVCAPEGMSDFLITVRASNFVEVCESLGFYQANTNGGI